MDDETTILVEKTSAVFPERSEGLTFLEQLTATQVSCRNFGVPFLYRSNFENRTIEYARGRCGLWSCKQCAMVNAQKWIARVIDGINKLPASEWYFATITAHRKFRSKKSSLKNIRDNWHKLRKRMARAVAKHDEELYYVRVWEQHQNGAYHMHLITNAQINTRWLKNNAAQCGLGYQAKIDKTVNAGQAAGYMAKYLLKQHESGTLYTYPKGARRIEASQNWVAWSEKGDEWHYAGDFETARGKAVFDRDTGWKVFDLSIRNEEKRRNEDTKQYIKRKFESDVNSNVHN